MTGAVAIVGMACRYPDADSPDELWENVLAQRRAFRRIPPERLRLEDYVSSDPKAPDRTYSALAAVLDGWEFDRVRFRIGGSTYRSSDLAHWLALEVAADALADSGFADGDGADRERTGVVVGNTLTGEFSRARALRLRWPYVRRTVGAALAREGWPDAERERFLRSLERDFKRPFPSVDEDTLAGSLSNTIAGRICNAFDFRGGGYTVDGACAASLLAVTTACAALAAGDLDLALAGGVDLSLDPFELVGFAKAGALARDEMRVYDARSAGFWPGEGCGFVTLMRLEDALAAGRRVHAVVRGYGISSDGRGGITRPEVAGQLLALRRAYARAGLGPESVQLFEGHGTGTSVGDRVELAALDRLRREAGATRPAAIGSVKANIGHTKAAAGVAGLIKAALGVREQVVPPTTGCEEPSEELTRPGALVRVVRAPEPWPAREPLRAAVSAMGFGGINSHVVLEGLGERRRVRLPKRVRRLGASAQDAELFLLAAPEPDGLDAQLARLEGLAATASRAELGDLAAELARRLPADQRARAALVASTPAELAKTATQLRAGDVDVVRGRCVAAGGEPPRVGFLFPGQGSPTYLDGGALARRIAHVGALYERDRLPTGGELADTSLAQPAIVLASLAGLVLLRLVGVTAVAAVGHSLGELTAFHWAGALDEAAVVALARARGRVMAELAEGSGAMAGIAAPRELVEPLLACERDVVIAGLNAPRQTVVSGPAACVAAVVGRALAAGLEATRLPVSHAFHSRLVAPAAAGLGAYLDAVPLRPLERRVASTITGGFVPPDADLRELLVAQVTSPVRFEEALRAVAERADVLLEVGPGHVLRDLARQSTELPVLALDAGGPSLRGPLTAAGALFALGAPLRVGALFAGRFTRPFPLDRRRAFLANPCELAPEDEAAAAPTPEELVQAPEPVGEARDALSLVRGLVAERCELPQDALSDEATLLGDLHLNSIQVSEIAVTAARTLGVAPPVAPAELATATVAELAAAVAGGAPVDAAADEAVGGVADWVRPFVRELVDAAPPAAAHAACAWHVLAPDEHPLAEAFAGAGEERGVALWLPRGAVDPGALLAAARAVRETGATRFALVHEGARASSFAKTLHLEAPHVHTCVVEVPRGTEALVRARAEAETTEGFREVVLGEEPDARRVPLFRLLEPRPGPPPLGSDDLLLVTGGGKGIGAECALALARSSGARVALLGRSRPEEDALLAANLRRFEEAGVAHRYASADVCAAEEVGSAVSRLEAELGRPVTALLHAAGRNEPTLLADLDDGELRATLAPKVEGFRNVLGLVDERRLRLVVGFGSIIARTGLRGEAHYGLANEALAREIEALAARLPACRCLCVEWSVWAGLGMGERLGVLEALTRAGVAPISVEGGLEALDRLLRTAETPTSVVVTGRPGALPTASFGRTELPLLRFLERRRVDVPRVELVVEAALDPATDPYLDDHRLEGTRLFPAVLGLEALAQAASALAGSPPRELRSVEFARPVTVPAEGKRTIRLAVLRRGRDVDVVLRSDETAFQADHFRAVAVAATAAREAELELPRHELALETDDLYGSILFQHGRFRRIRRYLRLDATSCVAEVAAGRAETWFGAYLPGELLLGDAGGRDAAVHAVQACSPHRRLVPARVERIRFLRPLEGLVRVSALERLRREDALVYDLELVDGQGRLCERWDGLELRAIGRTSLPDTWPPGLLAPYLERRVAELIPGTRLSVGFVTGNGDRAARRETAFAHVAGPAARVLHRPDGKPELEGEGEVSAAHLDGTTLAVSGPAPLGCDVEGVVPRDGRLWRDLLGQERFSLARALGSDAGEELDVSATRVWVAAECLRKAGRPAGAALVAGRSEEDGWVLLGLGDTAVATYATRLEAIDEPVVFGFLAGKARA
ncbi:MAG TPA: SDR family NAD(P)-dependent oxidoreductase [Gaiellaceae bacterium]|nr:SDR family NAD(P)-dependent oxidoreductase [Gaiellaceae bacterium]